MIVNFCQWANGCESSSQNILILGNLPDNVATINNRIPILRIVIYAVVFENGNLTYVN